MNRIGRRAHALGVITASWGLAWAAVGFLLGLACSLWGVDPLHLAPPDGALRGVIALISGMASAGLTLGALTGLTFAAVLGRAEGRRQVQALSADRLTAWGALAGVLWQLGWLGVARPWAVAGGLVHYLLAFVAVAVLGAFSGWLTLRVARRIGPGHAGGLTAAVTIHTSAPVA